MLSESDIRKKITQLRKSEGKIYAPLKYFRGLSTLKNVESRYKKMLKKDYTPFKTDKKVETKTSSYTSKFRKRYPGVTKLKDISKVTGIPFKNFKNSVRSWVSRMANWTPTRCESTSVGVCARTQFCC